MTLSTVEVAVLSDQVAVSYTHLTLDVGERLMHLLVGDRDRSRRHHHETEQQQRADSQQQNRVEREAPRPGARAGEGECRGVHESPALRALSSISLRTDAWNM